MALEPTDLLVVYVPVEATPTVLDALFAAGAGRVGAYQECAFLVRGRGQFRPVEGARPVIGQLDELEYVDEDRVEVSLPRRIRGDVVAALRAAHPYEEPVFHVLATADAEDTSV